MDNSGSVAPWWRSGVARGLQRLAGVIGDAPADTIANAAPADSVPVLVPAAGETAAEFADRRLRAVIEELYPTVAARVLALADAGTQGDVDEWVTVARVLYDQHMRRVGGPSVEARQRALLATLGQALEAQARSSARIAGYAENELHQPSAIEGDAAGTLVWEHYFCPQARLARSVLHGESVGDWLGALGELWTATDALYELVQSGASVPSDASATEGSGASDELLDALDRTKVALVRVQELSLW
ncbi:MAG: hypothetical protein JWL83_313 [Actinomycetia bacterium]|nr:hypothetical protein [Actinomycetes bacterium]